MQITMSAHIKAINDYINKLETDNRLMLNKLREIKKICDNNDYTQNAEQQIISNICFTAITTVQKENN